MKRLGGLEVFEEWIVFGLEVFEEGSIVLDRHFNTGSGVVFGYFGVFKWDLGVTGCVVCILLRIVFISLV